ncbi:Uncharacterised protein [Vibrio alginolyticus]|jgi:hypothetical protein|nr:Uncharacterised protein [Vibrio alginolyticus]
MNIKLCSNCLSRKPREAMLIPPSVYKNSSMNFDVYWRVITMYAAIYFVKSFSNIIAYTSLIRELLQMVFG